MTDDYYELLGVDADAPVDDIRAAYRDKRAAAAEQTKNKDTEQAKSDAAALNKAWNVLSDPYQRGRYDQQLAGGSDDRDDDEEDDDSDDRDAAPVSRKRPSRAVDRAEARRNSRAPLKPTVTLPPGTRFPATKQRLIAMGVDVMILIAIFLASQVGIVPKLEKSHHPAAYAAARDLTNNKIPAAHTKTSAANKAKSTADSAYTNLVKTKGANAPDTQTALATKKTADDAATKAKATEDALNKELTKQNKVLLPLQNLVSALFFLVALIVLIVPSLFGGQTIGKRTQGVRVIRVDGSPARVLDLFRRYTALVFAGYALSTLLGPVGALVVVFVATMWTRNPNQQALQDRFAKTLVVTGGDA